MNQDNIIRAYSRLVALKNNLPNGGWGIEEDYVNDYHQIVDILVKETATTLDEFKIPTNQINHVAITVWPDDPYSGRKAGATYSKERYCKRAVFLTKIDALLAYFDIKYVSTNEEKTEIGFKK